MAHPMGEAKQGPLGLGFDRRLKLELHGSQISSDGGLLPCRDLGHLRAIKGPKWAGRAYQVLTRG